VLVLDLGKFLLPLLRASFPTLRIVSFGAAEQVP